MWPCALAVLALLTKSSLSLPASPTISASPSPTIQLDNAVITGVSDATTRSFLGIPFAKPPTGSLRFQLPQPLPPYNGTLNATQFGKQCINSNSLGSDIFPTWATPQMVEYFQIFSKDNPSTFDEDCLNLNVIVPENVDPQQKLPVIAYIFFSGYDFSGSYNADGRIMVKHSVDMGSPIIWVSMNYRLGAYGFLPGKPIKDAGVGNLGFQDQREALRWVQKYIGAFGGDASRVTLLGLSAGASSATLQLVANGGDSEGLFHGVWAESGALQYMPYIDEPMSQAVYDNFVAATNCTSSSDTLQCLRDIPADVFQSVVANSDSAFWLITADGTFLRDLPQQELLHGNIAGNVSIVQGISEDEGTIATLTFPDGGNDTILGEFIKGVYVNITDDDLQQLLDLYPDDPSDGAPYNTGDQYQLAPQWKRIASIAGDIEFDAPHRLIAQTLGNQQPIWSYYYQRNFVYGFGVTHGAEIPNMYQAGDMSDKLISFANSFDPNPPSELWKEYYWPRYSTSSPLMLAFTGNDTFGYIEDTYRSKQIDFLNKLNKG